MDKEKNDRSFNRKDLIAAWNLFKDYFWNSDDRRTALLMLFAVLLATAGLVGLSLVFSFWSIGFWAALTAMSLPLFIAQMQQFAVLITIFVVIYAGKDYLSNLLSIRWRRWLTDKLIDEYTGIKHNNALDLSRHHEQLEHPDQRIQEDLKIVTGKTLFFITQGLDTTLTLACFIGSLWILSGVVTVGVLGFSVTIPGLLVWISLLTAGLTAFTMSKIGRALAQKSNQQEALEASFRKTLSKLNQEAESIAQEKGEKYFNGVLKNKLHDLIQNSQKINWIRTKLSGFRAFCQQVSGILPYLIATPLYFLGLMDFSRLMQVGFSYMMVQMSLDTYTNEYENLAQYKGSLNRVTQLQEALKDNGLKTSDRKIIKHAEKSHHLKVEHVNITYPSSTDYILKNLTLDFKPGEDVLIRGRSGCGKSTLLKVLAGTWRYGSGDVFIPEGDKICVLPQSPCIPHDTLKAVLAYPDAASKYSDEEYRNVLRLVRSMDKFIPQLNTVSNWQQFSGGERQRIAIARALLQKPQWLLVDEATSSLDPISEAHLYRLLKQELPNTTIISIAHRESLAQFHDKSITLTSQETHEEAQIDHTRESQVAANDTAIEQETLHERHLAI